MKKELFQKGWLEFNLKDLSKELYTQFNDIVGDENSLVSYINEYRISKTMSELSIEEFVKLYKDKYTDWDTTFEGKQYTNKLVDQATHPRHINGLFFGEYQRLMEVKNWLHDEIDGELGSSWAQFTQMNESNFPNMKSIFRKIVEYFYEDTPYKIDENRFGINLTCYTEKDVLPPHTDSDAEDKMAVVLIYANRVWNSEQGGQLKIGDYIVEPEFGKVIILENTENNPEHEVLRLNKGNRFAFSTFLHYNLDNSK